MSDDSKALWLPPQSAIVPAAAKTPREIAQCAKQLSPRDIKQIADAFDSENYEMVTSFVWMRAMAALKAQLATIGTDFIAEILGRGEAVRPGSLDENITEYEAIRLAEDLGMITSTDALRLRKSLETLTHFAAKAASQQHDELPEQEDAGEQMVWEEAVLTLRACVQSVLGHPRVQLTAQFVQFRRDLESRALAPAEAAVVNLAASPYFFQRTTLSILLALIKKAEGAELEHALANLNVLLPVMWPNLHKPERWQTGQTYAEVHSQGRTAATGGLKKALMQVRGFDYVPENLRSSTFIQAATDILRAHEGWQNFYNEPPPMRTLAALGTAIPMPAFAVCMSATLSIRLGNSYGCSWHAQEAAQRVLDGVSRPRWEYFLSECLPGDRRLLDKLQSTGPAKRWCELVVNAYKLHEIDTSKQLVRRLLDASAKSDLDGIEGAVKNLTRALGYTVT
jgi:hypothetical protein